MGLEIVTQIHAQVQWHYGHDGYGEPLLEELNVLVSILLMSMGKVIIILPTVRWIYLFVLT